MLSERGVLTDIAGNLTRSRDTTIVRLDSGSVLVDSSNRILQNSAANPLVLVIWLNLDFANFHRIRLVEQLNPTHAYTINLDD